MREGKGMRRIWKMMVGTVLLSAAMVLGIVPVSAEAATAAQKEKVKQKMIDIFYSVDTASYSMLGYSLRTSEFDEIYEELKTGEHERMLGSYYHDTYLKDYTFGSLVTRIQLINEDKDVLNRYKRVNENADAILAGIEPEMDDLDKVIYLHDAVADLVIYNEIGDQSYTLGGALGDGNAVCKGYAKALNLLLKETGFETDYVRNPSMMHGWSYVKLDGEWYHVDVTWDDKKKGNEEWVIRKYLLRNEAEFMAAGKNSHGDEIVHTGGSPVSESTRFSSWFMHDVVGRIAFEDGLWYYVDPVTKDIVRADADGSGYEVVVKYTGQTLTVVDMEGNELTYTEGGKTVVKDISDTESDVESDSEGGIGEDKVSEGSAWEEESEDILLGETESMSKPIAGAGELGMVDLCESNLWCEGKYDENGMINAASGYFSTTECYSVQATEVYSLVMKDTRFRMLVFEYSVEGHLIAVTELTSGNTHEMNATTAYVGLSMYMPIWKDLPLCELAKKLKYDLHTVEFILEGVHEVESEADEQYESETYVYEALDGVNLSDYRLWCCGVYNGEGEVEAKEGYFSTQKCYQVQAGGDYALEMKDSRFKVVVYEFSEKGNLLVKTEFGTGNTHRMNESTCYIGLSMYMPIWKDLPWDELVKKLKYNLHSVVITEK